MKTSEMNSPHADHVQTISIAQNSVASQKSLLDASIAERIRDAFFRHPDFDASGVDVRVAGGVVALAGVVTDPSAQFAVETIAQSISGVKEVINTVIVHPVEIDASNDLIQTPDSYLI
ncbi:MAG: BON domain-containing protein [Proteobacteria bacterium]|nr:MAG: BON domain-containing protein [Pseudomonadota bacterium]